MHKYLLIKYLLIIIASIFLISCGFKGPLYLPKNAPSAEQTTNKNASDVIDKNTIESGL